MKTMVVAIVSLALLTGCASTPLTDAGLAVAVRIAVRHAVIDSPRAAEKAANIRLVVLRLQQIATAETTVGALKAEVIAQIDRLDLSPIERADALDLLTYFAAVIEAKIGPETFDSAKLIVVQDFLALILATVPVGGVEL